MAVTYKEYIQYPVDNTFNTLDPRANAFSPKLTDLFCEICPNL